MLLVITGAATQDRLTMSFGARAALATHPVAAQLLSIMESKRTNVCVSADVESAQELIDLAKQVGSHICALKTHGDAMADLTKDAIEQLQDIAREMNFLLFEDRCVLLQNIIKH